MKLHTVETDTADDLSYFFRTMMCRIHEDAEHLDPGGNRSNDARGCLGTHGPR